MRLVGIEWCMHAVCVAADAARKKTEEEGGKRERRVYERCSADEGPTCIVDVFEPEEGPALYRHGT